MSEAPVADGRASALSGAQLLELAVDRLLTESSADLPEQVALDRARSVLACTERLSAVRLRAVADVDRRELFALDGAGSTRGWLRTQPGGEGGQLTAARRLRERPLVEAALGAGQVSARAAEQLCGVLDKVPVHVDEELLSAVLLDGVGGLLQTFTGGLVPDDAVTPDLLAARAESARVLEACAADVTAAPARRLEPALVLLASHVTASHLGPGLRQLLEALLPDGADGVDRDPYFFELRELLDGDVDVRGHLTPEVGHGLAAEIARRVAHANAQATQAADADTTSPEAAAEGAVARPTSAAHVGEHVESAADEGSAYDLGAWDAAFAQATWPASAGPAGAGTDSDSGPADRLEAWDTTMAGGTPRPGRPADPSAPRAQDPGRPVSAGRRRHDALGQLLHDLADITPGDGRPSPPHLTIIATLGALEGRLGALPAQLTTTGPAATLTTPQLQRLACTSDLDAVLLDALGNPVGASRTRRNLTRRERRALRAQWGSTCAVAGCPNTVTVPHHVEPFWLTGHTRLRDMIPACEHCHRDLHDGHRTLRLRDGRLINEFGWIRACSTAA